MFLKKHPAVFPSKRLPDMFMGKCSIFDTQAVRKPYRGLSGDLGVFSSRRIYTDYNEETTPTQGVIMTENTPFETVGETPKRRISARAAKIGAGVLCGLVIVGVTIKVLGSEKTEN